VGAALAPGDALAVGIGVAVGAAFAARRTAGADIMAATVSTHTSVTRERTIATPAYAAPLPVAFERRLAR
jgi:hypothetical protein